MSINTPSLVGLILAAFLLSYVLTYRMISGQRKLIPAYLDLVNDQGQNGPIVKTIPRMYVMPYQIYEYHQKKSNITIFIMVKADYADLLPLLLLKSTPSDLPSQQEQKALFAHLPEVVMIEGAENEFLEVQLLSESLESRQIVIKNSSGPWHDYNSRRYDLNFYALQTHKTLFKVISSAYLRLGEIKQQTQDQYKEDEEQPTNTTQLMANKKKQIIQRILPNKTLWQSQDFTHILLQKIHNETIYQGTKWRAMYDGFCLKYFSVTTKIEEGNFGSVELISRMVSQGEKIRSKVIKEPINFLKFLSIDYLDVCIQGERWSMLVSDGKKGYLIDISKEEWNLVKHIKIVQNNLKTIFFGKSCKIYGLHVETIQTKTGGGVYQQKPANNKNTGVLEDIRPVQSKQDLNDTEQNNDEDDLVQANVTEIKQNQKPVQFKIKNESFVHIVQYFPKNEKKSSKKLQVDHYLFLNRNYMVLCSRNNSCVIVQTEDFQPVLSMTLDNKTVQLSISKQDQVKYRIHVINKTIQIFIQVLNPQTLAQKLIPISQQILFNNNILNYSSALTNTIYSIDIYSNKSKLISQEMDREIYQHLELNNLIPTNKHKRLYQQIFDNQHLEEKCIIVADVDSSQIEIRYNQTQEWLVCALEIETKQYLQMRLLFQEKYLNYQLYLCSSYVQPNNYRMNIACAALLEPLADTQVAASFSMSHSLNGNYFYKLFTVRQNEKMVRNLPGIFLKDIQREQIELASAVFFVIMIVLSLLLLALVLVLALKSIFINLLIYYGWVRQREEPTYPLAWFPLKTKLKRLQQNGILSFVEYQPSIGDTEGNHCCFCLEVMRSKTYVASIYCGHEFHKECFSEWIKNEPNSRCPTCRRPFTRTGLLEYQNGLGSHQQIALI